ncbi:SLAP domain-containing protein [Lacticaseibacillus brantae]|uniref:Uncharacterized protein n=1 Tax=Lacticaseibacillus brantae DSM 23927 TaxID=1423727 RepID=A0A0R2B8Y0_9LACO|nr:SLAP domain-containing protein [Lacticaseibacillus brantae]KRM72060.1 hypothetical protein FC34_GL001043 [Lacticaseibacillus brantae DSM 23927]
MGVKRTIFTALAAVALLGTGVSLVNAPTAQAAAVATTQGRAYIHYVKGYSIAVWTTPTADRQLTGKTIKDGSQVTYVDKTTGADGHVWYKLADNQWISGQYAVSQVIPQTSGTLLINEHPAFGVPVFDSPNADQLGTGRILKGGQQLPFVDAQFGFDGHVWYKLGNNEWVNSQFAGIIFDNGKGTSEPIRIKYTPGYSIAVWNSPLINQQPTAKKLKHGTVWKTFKMVEYNNTYWYNLGGNQWINGKYTEFAN